MYEPRVHQAANLAFLWPAIAAASASELAALVAKQLTGLAVGRDGRAVEPPRWATPHTVALELSTVRLRDFSTGPKSFATLVCAPFALHGAAICDLVAGHSLVGALRAAGLGRLMVADWRSATAEMRYLGIDDYLANLNVLIDQIGAPVDLIGLCQGGWLALVYAARFPQKIRKLVLAGAPIDTAAASSSLSMLADSSSLAVFHELVRLGDGVVPGQKVLKFWGPETLEADDIRQLLHSEAAVGSPDFARLEAAFRSWSAWTVDLPGTYFMEVVEKLYKRNELASGEFVALGQRIDLKKVTAPIFLLAARDDELVAPPQLFAAEGLVGSAARDICKAVVPCRHTGLFMDKRILNEVWPRIVHWLAQPTQPSAALAPAHALEQAH